MVLEFLLVPLLLLLLLQRMLFQQVVQMDVGSASQ